MASVFSEAQIAALLAHIDLPKPLQKQRYSSNPKNDLHLLSQVHIHMISTIPYENLSIHYSKDPARRITIDPLAAFDKIVTAKRGRGGYCFEINILCHHLLRGLGFNVYMSPVRIRYRVDGIPQGEFKGWTHVVNIVTLSDGTKWSSDTGFGGDGPTSPLQLVENEVRRNLGSQENRLIKDWIPTQTLRTEGSKLWIYQYRNSVEQDWNSFYAFGEFEAMEADFHVMNWFAGSSPESFQTYRQVVVKFLRRSVHGGGTSGGKEGSGDSEIYGKRMSVNEVIKENLGGKTQVVKVCGSESERIEAFREWFGIEFTEVEKMGIRGWSTELK